MTFLTKDPRDLTFQMSSLAHLFDAFYPAPDDDDDDWGPAGPSVSDRLLWVLLNPQPLPPRHSRGLLAFGPHPEPWKRAAISQPARGLALGRLAADRFVMMAQIAESAGQAGHDGVQKQLSQFVDDWCATPPRPRWPLPWPFPGTTADLRVHPSALIGMGVEFFRMSERLSDSALAPSLADAGNRLAQAGLERLAHGL